MSDLAEPDDASAPGMHDPEVTKIVVAELQRMYTRIENTNDSTTTVIQFIVLVFGAAALAADKFHEAIVAMPVFWTVWLLYSQITDFNTLKYSAAARRLERIANSRLGTDVFVWESSMANRTNRRPLIFWVNYVFWAAMNGSAWIIALVVLRRTDHKGWTGFVCALWAITWTAAFTSSVVMRGRHIGQFERSLASRAELDGMPSQGRPAGDTP